MLNFRNIFCRTRKNSWNRIVTEIQCGGDNAKLFWNFCFCSIYLLPLLSWLRDSRPRGSHPNRCPRFSDPFWGRTITWIPRVLSEMLCFRASFLNFTSTKTTPSSQHRRGFLPRHERFEMNHGIPENTDKTLDLLKSLGFWLDQISLALVSRRDSLFALFLLNFAPRWVELDSAQNQTWHDCCPTFRGRRFQVWRLFVSGLKFRKSWAHNFWRDISDRMNEAWLHLNAYPSKYQQNFKWTQTVSVILGNQVHRNSGVTRYGFSKHAQNSRSRLLVIFQKSQSTADFAHILQRPKQNRGDGAVRSILLPTNQSEYFFI